MIRTRTRHGRFDAFRRSERTLGERHFGTKSCCTTEDSLFVMQNSWTFLRKFGKRVFLALSAMQSIVANLDTKAILFFGFSHAIRVDRWLRKGSMALKCSRLQDLACRDERSRQFVHNRLNYKSFL